MVQILYSIVLLLFFSFCYLYDCSQNASIHHNIYEFLSQCLVVVDYYEPKFMQTLCITSTIVDPNCTVTFVKKTPVKDNG